ncbi:MAG TPA: hypothetical protein VF898_05640 [Chloroflexota bacterium]
MYSTGLGIHDCNPVARARSYQQDMLREAAQYRLQVEASRAASKETNESPGLLVRVMQLLRAERSRQVAPSH